MRDDVIGRNKEVEQLVRESCRQRDGGHSWLCVAVADAHGAVKQMRHAIDYINGMDVVDAGIFLGDMTDYVYFNQMDCSWYSELLKDCNKPFLTTIGNHDTGNDNDPAHSYALVDDMYKICIQPNLRAAGAESEHCFYYRDFAEHRLRIIVLNQYDHPGDIGEDGRYVYARNRELYSREQIDFLIRALGDTPRDYAVMILLHNSPGRMVTEEVEFSSTYFRGEGHNRFGLPSYIDGPIVADIVEAWIQGTSLDKTYKVTPGSSSVTELRAEADYTQRGRGEFIAYIGGHYHNSIVSHVESYPDQGMYSVDCLGTDPHTIQYSDTPRVEETRDEDCWVTIAVDREARLLKIVRIGARESLNGDDRLYYEMKW